MDNYNGFNEHENNEQANAGYYGNYPGNNANLNNENQGNSNNNNKKRKKSHPMAFVLIAALLVGGSAGGGVYLGNMLSAKQASVNIAATETAEKEKTKNTVTLATTT